MSTVPTHSLPAPIESRRLPPVHGLRRLSATQVALKRLFDLLVGVPLLVLALPLMAVVGTAILLLDGRPVFFRQRRVTRGGRLFHLWKFRTMVPDAEAGTGPIWASRCDPRCTRLGRWLRRTSLDELPQLFNVLGGTMSLVGPRPERPVFVMQFRRQLPMYEERLSVPAGITGWAQVRGFRGATDLRRRLAHDLLYIEQWSLGFDLLILLRTLFGGFLHRSCRPNAVPPRAAASAPVRPRRSRRLVGSGRFAPSRLAG